MVILAQLFSNVFDMCMFKALHCTKPCQGCKHGNMFFPMSFGLNIFHTEVAHNNTWCFINLSSGGKTGNICQVAARWMSWVVFICLPDLREYFSSKVLYVRFEMSDPNCDWTTIHRFRLFRCQNGAYIHRICCGYLFVQLCLRNNTDQ